MFGGFGPRPQQQQQQQQQQQHRNELPPPVQNSFFGVAVADAAVCCGVAPVARCCCFVLSVGTSMFIGCGVAVLRCCVDPLYLHIYAPAVSYA
jgi:hypothetical protein